MSLRAPRQRSGHRKWLGFTGGLQGCTTVVDREERLLQESQNYVGGSATIRGALGDLKCQKRLLKKPVTFSGLWENVGADNNTFWQQSDVRARLIPTDPQHYRGENKLCMHEPASHRSFVPFD